MRERYWRMRRKRSLLRLIMNSGQYWRFSSITFIACSLFAGSSIFSHRRFGECARSIVFMHLSIRPVQKQIPTSNTFPSLPESWRNANSPMGSFAGCKDLSRCRDFCRTPSSPFAAWP